MDAILLDSQASQLRSEVLKERQKRFELEAKLRLLEQQLLQSSQYRGVPGQIDGKRPLISVEAASSDSGQNGVDWTPTGASASPNPELGSSSTGTRESAANAVDSPRRGDIFDLEAERDWLNSVQLPVPQSASRASRYPTSSKRSSEMSSVHSEESEQDRGQMEINSTEEIEAGLGPSLSQYALRQNTSTGEGGWGSQKMVLGSPTLNGGQYISLDPKLMASGSSWTVQETSRRRYDEAALRVSQLKIEVAEYKQVLAESAAQSAIAKRKAEHLNLELSEAQSSIVLLREQVREKNRRILELIGRESAVEALEKALEEATKEKLSLQVQLGAVQRAHQSTLESEEALKRQLEKMESALKMKDAEVVEKNESMVKLAEKLMELKHQLQIIVPHLCKFSVSTVQRFSKSVVVSIGVLKPNAERQRELEIVTSGKRVTHASSFVVSISFSATHKDRFAVTYRNGDTDTFESARREEVVNSLNSHLFSTNDSDAQ